MDFKKKVDGDFVVLTSRDIPWKNSFIRNDYQLFFEDDVF